MTNLEGQSFAGYEIIAKCGEGGMGSVWKARQPMLNRLIALKMMSAELAADPEFVRRFQREANTAAGLNHPNIVQVFSAGESNGIHYIAMEFVDGETVKDRFDRHGRLDAAEALAICVYVAEALKYAWNKNQLIHRDIKPHNIFLTASGEVRLGDMGLAKTLGGTTTSLTQTGMMMGSPHYISPEQAKGAKDIDFRADIYSLGCTLFHLVTGRPPYEGDDSLVVIGKHVHEPPPAIFKVWSSCPVPLGMLVGKMLAKNRNDRFGSYEELIAEMIRVREKLAPAVSAPPASSSEPTKVAAATPKPAPVTPTPKPVIAKTPTPRPAKSRIENRGLRIAVGVGAAVALIACLLFWAPWASGPSPGQDANARSIDAAFIAEVAKCSPANQARHVLEKLKELNPGFDGRGTHRVENGVVVELRLSASKLQDISAVAALRGLQVFHCNASPKSRSQLADISPLRGLPLVSLDATYTEVSDLSPLAGMPLTNLHIHGVKVGDLSPLRGMKLTRFCCAGTQVTDLSPLRGMELGWFVCDAALFKSPDNLALVRGMTTLKSILNKPAAQFWKELESGKLTSEAAALHDTSVELPPATAGQPRQTLDLLALTDPVNDRITVASGASRSKANAWERRGGALVYASDGGSGKVVAPVAIHARSYEIELEFERLSGAARLHADLALETGRIVPIYVECPGRKILGGSAGANCPVPKDDRGRAVVRLDRGTNGGSDRVTMRFNDELVLDWQGDVNRFAMTGEPYPQFTDQLRPSLYSHGASYKISSWQLRVFDGEATVLRGSAAMPADFPKETSLDLGGGVKMELVLVPAGEFMMGSNDGPANEKPVHKVRISAPFYMGKYEVTVGQFKRFVAETQYQTEAERFNNGWMNTSRGWGPVPGVNWRTPVKFTQADDHPVCVVSWNDIQEFCKWASKQTGRAVRLPTEAQWEYACRAGTTTQFNTTDKDSELGEAAWFAANSGQRTHPVGQKKPNAWGLYDMHGNLYEMVQEFYSDKYDAEQFVVDPQGSAAGGGRQMRGGGWGNNPASVRSACRKKIGLDEASIGNTFRVITDALPASASATTDVNWPNAINLLPLVDLSQDVNSGKWETAPDGLKATDIKSMSQKIQPPYRPPEEYDYRVSFTPITGNADVAIGLTAKGRSFVFYMKKYANDHCLGFEAISGKNIAGGPTAHRFPHLENGRQYTVVVEVRKNGLRGYLDGKLVAEWATDYSDMSAWPVWKFKDDTLPGFGCSLSTVVFQEVKLREVTGKGTLLRQPPK